MLSSISQNSYQYENENTLGESVIDSCNNILSSSKDTIRHNQHANNNNNNRDDKFRLNTTDIDLTTNSTQRENNFQLQQHEREQHLHQLQSINNMLLDNNNQTNSYSAINSSGTMKNTNSAGMDDITITDLLGLGITRGGLLGSNQRDHQGNMNNYNSSPYRSYQNYEDSVYSPSSSSNFDVPSSPSNSFQTSMTPSTPGSSYTTPYSNSSVPNSPYTTISNGTNSIGRSNHQYPVSSSRSSSCYGRPIRGSPPYSDCESPSIEYPPYMFGCNGARSQSPSGSDQSGNSFDGAQLSDIMNYLSLNSMPRPCHPSSLSTMMSDPEKCCSKRTPLDIHKLKKFLHTSEYQHQQPINRYHYHHGHVTSHNRHFNQHHISQKIHPEKICCSGSNYRVNNISSPSSYSPHDKPTHWQRNSSDSKKVKYTWSGQFSKKNVKAIGYSTKVFLGGTPWDIKESDLISAFKEFGQVKVEWPPLKNGEPQKGFAYIIMESEKQVKALLSNCTQEYKDGGNCFYFKMSSKRMRGKEVEVIPWAINNSNYVKNSSQKLDGDKTVFVGALHGMMTAINLAAVMNDLFDNVVYAGIDTERNKYPIGSARVTFCNRQSYLKAIEAGFVEIKTDKFRKIIQIDPYLEESPCSRCFVQQGPYFCREMTCFKYYCHTCWQWQHSSDAMNWHEPMSRGLKNSQVIGFNKSPNPMHSVKNFSV